MYVVDTGLSAIYAVWQPTLVVLGSQ